MPRAIRGLAAQQELEPAPPDRIRHRHVPSLVERDQRLCGGIHVALAPVERIPAAVVSLRGGKRLREWRDRVAWDARPRQAEQLVRSALGIRSHVRLQPVAGATDPPVEILFLPRVTVRLQGAEPEGRERERAMV